MKQGIGLLALLFSLCLFPPAAAEAATALPDGVVALSPGGMPWEDAQAYCASHGGGLPLFDGKKRVTSPDGSTPNKYVALFGFDGTQWPDGLPYGHYWLGTELNTRPGHAWKVFDSNGKVVVTFASKKDFPRAVCVAPEDAPKKNALRKITVVGVIEMPGSDGTGSIAGEGAVTLLWNERHGQAIYAICQVGQTCEITAMTRDDRIVELLSVAVK